MLVTSPPGRWRENPPSTPGTSWFLRRTLANVPRIITSWWPRRAPYWLKSFGSTPWSIRNLPAGESFLMLPAGEMWSVVMLSPNSASTRAPVISVTGGGVIVMPTKYGGLAMYVLLAFHWYRSPVGACSAFQFASPSYTEL